LEDRPGRAECGLPVTDFDVPEAQDPEKVAIVPELLEVNRLPPLLGSQEEDREALRVQRKR
jgi:hypothetical protein